MIMVTPESNRGQPSATATLERQRQAYQPPAGSGTAQFHSEERAQSEERAAIQIRDPLWFMSLTASGATIGATLGLSGLVLAILGLSGVLPVYLLAVAGIVLGFGLLTLGAVDTTWARMFRFAERETSRERTIFASGVAAASIAGLAAIVLSLLSFVFLGDTRLGALAVIVLGLGLLWHTGVVRRVSHFTHYVTYRGAEGQRPSGPFAVNALSLAPVRDFLVGLGGAILGILAMMNVTPVTLTFVALLIIGGALASTASTICGASLTTLKGACSKNS